MFLKLEVKVRLTLWKRTHILCVKLENHAAMCSLSLITSCHFIVKYIHLLADLHFIAGDINKTLLKFISFTKSDVVIRLQIRFVRCVYCPAFSSYNFNESSDLGEKNS